MLPGILLLQLETELSKRTLLRCLSDLENKAWIKVERKSYGPRSSGNQYVLNEKKLLEDQRPRRGATMTPVESEIDTPPLTVLQVPLCHL